MKLSTEQYGTITVIHAEGRLEVVSAKKFRDYFHEIAAHSESMDFILNFAQLDFIDSTGIGTILSCLKEAHEKHGDIFVAALSPKVRMLFEITRAYRVFEIFDSVADALAAYNNQIGELQ